MTYPRPTHLQFWGLEIRRSTYCTEYENVDSRISWLYNCERVGRAVSPPPRIDNIECNRPTRRQEERKNKIARSLCKTACPATAVAPFKDDGKHSRDFLFSNAYLNVFSSWPIFWDTSRPVAHVIDLFDQTT